MAPGHDDHIIVRRQGNLPADFREIPTENSLRPGEQGGIGELGPVIVDHRTEAHGRDGGHQGPGDVAAAEDIDPSRPHHGDSQPGAGQGGFVSQQGEQVLRRGLQMPGAVPVRRTHGGGLLLDVQHQPGVQVPAGSLHQVPQDGDGIGVPGGEILEAQRHTAAADHAQAGGIPLDETEVPQGAAAALQKLRGQPLGLVLHISAADGPQGPPPGEYRHQRPCSPGRRAAGLRHSHQLRRCPRLQGVDNLPHQFPHMPHPLLHFLL